MFDGAGFIRGLKRKKREMTPLLEAAATRGCRFQVGTDMLFEQIPAYLEFFGYGTTTPEELRAVAEVSY
jgi:shikimate dehydrogenase